MGTKQKGLLRGNKFNGKHTTLITAAERVVVQLRDDDRVTKIVIGIIKSRKGGASTLKATEITAGLKITVTSASNVQELYAYTGDPQNVKKDLEENWTKAF
jgi:Predicted metal-binding protein (DUF2103)